MALWMFRTYVSPQGEEEVARWYAGQSFKVQAAFDKRLQALSQMAPQEWHEPYTKQLVGPCDGLVEIRFFADRVQHRPLGFYGPNRMEFTITFMAREIGDQLEPKDACEKALARKNEVLHDPVRTTRIIVVG